MANKEQLSALVDNELTDATLLDLLANEPEHTEHTEQWSNYHLIGDVLRGDAPKQIDIDIASKVASALEQEPAIVAPKPQVTETKESSVKVVRFFKYAGQYAIAASVAVAAIIGVQQYSFQAGDAEQPLPVFNTVPVGGAVAPVSLQSNPQPRELSEAEIIEQRKRISAYLQDHRFQQRIVE
ncbi:MULTISPECIES: sigma-E factor negative regulatory protein [unclassified Agarivorans]|uniref:sigma-E factor negative regulatory protein n=1 Tax=unclassified Agarivorans TaxID=2636026 RepID=UPI0026E154D0|nr:MULTISPECIES: RseA family anti-sigma factor [unclassified Agarivorans]MDO6684309.1 RseA family anti-sigma factor [Agarivorans sp. 3_MG-2023]MDO6714474.1 RseA family anti-sigma factor [Agarivorans sp. 2_MG-2023]